MFLFLNLNLSHLWYFDIICANVIYAPGEKIISIYLFLLRSKTFLINIIKNILAKRGILGNFPKTECLIYCQN